MFRARILTCFGFDDAPNKSAWLNGTVGSGILGNLGLTCVGGGVIASCFLGFSRSLNRSSILLILDSVLHDVRYE